MEKEHSMPDIFISKEKFARAIKQLMGRYRVYAPVKNGFRHEFALLQNAAEADLGFSNTFLSPKGLFQPQAERMFEYSAAMTRTPASSRRRKRIFRRVSFWESGRATQKPFNSMTPTSTQKPSKIRGGLGGAKPLP
jgi:hypothetical protein